MLARRAILLDSAMAELPPQPPPEPEPEVDAFLDHPLRRMRAWIAASPPRAYVVTRFVLLRLLGLVYFVAFASAATQVGPLLGPRGLLPAESVLQAAIASHGSALAAFLAEPTLLLFTGASNTALAALCWTGAALSACVLVGATNAILQLALWALYMSLVHVGQIFYGYGWESQLLETGFLAVFLCPVRSVRPFASAPPPVVVIGLFRWLIVRVMLGAGLIKLRGDSCWRDLTCLVYHYETQPVPSPVSWLLHAMPRAFHVAGVIANHTVELVAPFFAFGPRRARLAAGVLFVAFQLTLIASGNLSFLNWLTIVPAVACFDDELLGRLIPARWRAAAAAAPKSPSRAARVASYVLLAVVLVLSVGPVQNLISPAQSMNRSFDRLELVNTYGAFGTIGRERFEVILEGTSDATLDDHTRWLPYELPCQPGDVRRRPCLITPWHYRLDWQMWFAAFTGWRRQPWLIHLVWQLLRGEGDGPKLLRVNPFPDRPPRFVRATLYRYRFTAPGDGSGAWWRREREAEYLRPLAVDDPWLTAAVRSMGWTDR
jgi:hypothetical protein